MRAEAPMIVPGALWVPIWQPCHLTLPVSRGAIHPRPGHVICAETRGGPDVEIGYATARDSVVSREEAYIGSLAVLTSFLANMVLISRLPAAQPQDRGLPATAAMKTAAAWPGATNVRESRERRPLSRRCRDCRRRYRREREGGRQSGECLAASKRPAAAKQRPACPSRDPVLDHPHGTAAPRRGGPYCLNFGDFAWPSR